MADVATAIIDRLKAVSAVTSLVGSTTSHRGWAQNGVPEGRSRPCYTCEVLATSNVDYLGGRTALDSALVRITSYADSHAGRVALADAIYAGLPSTGGTWGSVVVTECYAEDSGADDDIPAQDASDARIYYRRQTFRVWHYTS
jgi:hypothetical protein